MIRIGFSRHGSRAAIALGVSAIAATLAIGAVGAFDGTGAATLAATKTQDQTRARDGSCIVDGVTCEPIRDRLHDGTGGGQTRGGGGPRA